MVGHVGHDNPSQFALLNCTQPGRGKSQAIEHNRALPKVGQSLRKAALGGLPLRALRVRVMVGYVLRPSPDKGYVGALRGSSQCCAPVAYAQPWGCASAPDGVGAGRRCRWSDGGVHPTRLLYIFGILTILLAGRNITHIA